jgi:flagellar biosynthesis/type III secretory pathway M-ring protein FliF/YscJ
MTNPQIALAYAGLALVLFSVVVLVWARRNTNA